MPSLLGLRQEMTGRNLCGRHARQEGGVRPLLYVSSQKAEMSLPPDMGKKPVIELERGACACAMMGSDEGVLLLTSPQRCPGQWDVSRLVSGNKESSQSATS